jgi:hypothetical protein
MGAEENHTIKRNTIKQLSNTNSLCLLGNKKSKNIADLEPNFCLFLLAKNKW